MTKHPDLGPAARGARTARAGLPKGTRREFLATGYFRSDWPAYSRGYDDAFAAMTPEERRAAALRDL